MERVPDCFSLDVGALASLLARAEALTEACRDALEDGEFSRSPRGRRLKLAVVELEGAMNKRGALRVEVRG